MSGPGLAIEGLSKRFGDLQAVADLSLQVGRGELIGFLGPNGAGKTTTMRSIVGMVRPDSGTITWDGAPVDDKLRTRTGYMPQERGLYPRMKVKEQAAYFGRLAGMSASQANARADYWLERVGLEGRHDSLVQELSGGNQQRVQLVAALVYDPDLLVLDEPFAGLDPVAAETMRAIISERAEQGAAVLFSSHQLDLVEGLCEHVVIVASGRTLASGAISELRAASPVRRMTVTWTDPTSWTPPDGDVIEQSATRCVANLSASSDLGASVASAVAAGTVRDISVEPPGLDEVFVELVEQSDRAPEMEGAT